MTSIERSTTEAASVFMDNLLAINALGPGFTRTMRVFTALGFDLSQALDLASIKAGRDFKNAAKAMLDEMEDGAVIMEAWQSGLLGDAAILDMLVKRYGSLEDAIRLTTQATEEIAESVDLAGQQWEEYYDIIKRGQSATQRLARPISQEDIAGMGMGDLLKAFLPGGQFQGKQFVEGVTIPESLVQALAAATVAQFGIPNVPRSVVAGIFEDLMRTFRSAGANIAKMGRGGIISEPTLLYGLRSMRPYAVAGESGREVVSPMGGGGYGTADIRIYLGDERLVDILGQKLTDRIRVRQGLRL